MAAAIAGFSPIRSTFAPIAPNSGASRSSASAGPAAITDSFPAAATSGRPSTCADTKPCPAPACAAASRSVSATLTVLHDTCSTPGPADSTPPAPEVTASTAASFASMLNTMPARAASAGLPATRAPRAASASAFPALRFHTVTRCPASSSRPAIPDPICPRPRNPTSIRSVLMPLSSLNRERRLPGEFQRWGGGGGFCVGALRPGVAAQGLCPCTPAGT